MKTTLRNTWFAILIVMNSTAWAVTYQPYVGAPRTSVPGSTQVRYDMPDFRFYSTSIYQSNQGYGTSRIAQNGGVKPIATAEQVALQRTTVSNGFNILGNARDRKPMTPRMWILDGVSMNSTSTMLSSTRNNRQDPTVSNTNIRISQPRRISNPDEDDEDNIENGTPVGDAMWPLLLLAMTYAAVVVRRRRKHNR